MRQRRAPQPTALAMVIGGPGLSGMLVVALATGVGLLLDFQVTGLHPVFSVGAILASVPASMWWTIRRTQARMNPKIDPSHVRNLALATVAGQAGCGTVVIIFLALFGGMYLDSRLDTHPVFTIGLVLAAIPVSLYAMVRLVLSAVEAIQLPPSESRARGASQSEQSATKENGS